MKKLIFLAILFIILPFTVLAEHRHNPVFGVYRVNETFNGTISSTVGLASTYDLIIEKSGAVKIDGWVTFTYNFPPSNVGLSTLKLDCEGELNFTDHRSAIAQVDCATVPLGFYAVNASEGVPETVFITRFLQDIQYHYEFSHDRQTIIGYTDPRDTIILSFPGIELPDLFQNTHRQLTGIKIGKRTHGDLLDLGPPITNGVE